MSVSYNTHDLGDSVRLSTGADGFTVAATGVAVDPDVVKLSVRTPVTLVTTTYVYGTDVELVKDSTGKYHADISVDEAGFWYYRFWSTGDGQAADEQRFKVEEANAV